MGHSALEVHFNYKSSAAATLYKCGLH